MFDTLARSHTRPPALAEYVDEVLVCEPPGYSPDLDAAEAAADRQWSRGFVGVPAELESMPPGPGLATLLASLAARQLSAEDRVTVMAAHQRLVSHFQAKVHADIAALTDHYLTDPACEDDVGLALDAVSVEVSAELRWTRRTTDMAVDRAWRLTTSLPQVGRALGQGHLDLPRARVLVEGTLHLPDDEARDIVDQIIEAASDLTTGQLRVRLRRLCMESRPDEAADRYRSRLEDRRVILREGDDGTAELLGLDLPADQATAAARRIDDFARLLEGDDPTMDQKRADVLLDLVLGIDNHIGRGGVVDIHVDLTTLTGLSNHPGELGGYGPVIADIARQLVDRHHRAEWRWTLTDPDTGRVVDVGTTRRRPDTHQRRLVEAHDPTCIFPGCRVPSRRCDIDHSTPWVQSHRTHTRDLAPICRRHHVIRHRHDWTYTIDDDGTITWTSPHGHRYTTPPPRPPP